ncbi:hypothetical protein Tco_0817111 [Tanacetum coccineum]
MKQTTSSTSPHNTIWRHTRVGFVKEALTRALTVKQGTCPSMSRVLVTIKILLMTKLHIILRVLHVSYTVVSSVEPLKYHIDHSPPQDLYLKKCIDDMKLQMNEIMELIHEIYQIHEPPISFNEPGGSDDDTETGMVDFVSGHVVIDAAHRKRVKYEAKCANIRYGFLPFSFSSLGELEKDAVGWGCDKPLRPANILLYSWDGGLDVCVNLTGSSPLTQTGMVDFAPDRAVIDAAQRKRGKYMAKCAAIGYGFLPFSFSSLGELEADYVTLLKRI